MACIHILTIIFFLRLIPPKPISLDVVDVFVAPSFPRGLEFVARDAVFLRELDFHVFFDDIIAADEPGLDSGHADTVLRPIIGRHD